MSILGTSLDDAAGECFDKVARVLGMPYPGGAALDKMAQTGNEHTYSLPRSKPGENPYNMSFSGLKTAALNLIHHAEQLGEEIRIPDLCAAFSAAVSDTLVPRVELAIRETGCKKIAVAGGVAANSRLRRDILEFVLYGIQFLHVTAIQNQPVSVHGELAGASLSYSRGSAGYQYCLLFHCPIFLLRYV